MAMPMALEPRRLALRYSPPALIVEYARESERSTTRRLFHHEIDLGASLSSRQDVRDIVEELVQRHAPLLGKSKVSTGQLERLVSRLAERVAPQAAAQLPQADYNRVSEAQLKQVKQKMDQVFEKNIIRPGEEGYEYDKRVEFHAAQETSDWDDD